MNNHPLKGTINLNLSLEYIIKIEIIYIFHVQLSKPECNFH